MAMKIMNSNGLAGLAKAPSPFFRRNGQENIRKRGQKDHQEKMPFEAKCGHIFSSFFLRGVRPALEIILGVTIF